jgi:hypothetical protein
MKLISKREFLAGGSLGALGLGVGSALAAALKNPAEVAVVGRKPGTDALGRTLKAMQEASAQPPPNRLAKFTKLFLTPPGYPNAIATDPEGRGFWVAEQRHDGRKEAVWLLDFKGKLLDTIYQNTKDCTGMTIGDGCIWSACEGAAEFNHPDPPIDGVFQTDIKSGQQVSRRQIPFGPANDGGSSHGMAWENGKLWLAADRMGCLMKIDPNTWQVEYMFRETRLPQFATRVHGIEYDNGYIWQVGGLQKPGTYDYRGYTAGLVKYDIKTGQVVETITLPQGIVDMHDVAVHNGELYGVDAGEHPGWSIDIPQFQHKAFPPENSPTGGYVFRIDLV